MPNATYKLNRKCQCGKPITDQSKTGMCRKCYVKAGRFVGKLTTQLYR